MSTSERNRSLGMPKATKNIGGKVELGRVASPTQARLLRELLLQNGQASEGAMVKEAAPLKTGSTPRGSMSPLSGYRSPGPSGRSPSPRVPSRSLEKDSAENGLGLSGMTLATVKEVDVTAAKKAADDDLPDLLDDTASSSDQSRNGSATPSVVTRTQSNGSLSQSNTATEVAPNNASSAGVSRPMTLGRSSSVS